MNHLAEYKLTLNAAKSALINGKMAFLNSLIPESLNPVENPALALAVHKQVAAKAARRYAWRSMLFFRSLSTGTAGKGLTFTKRASSDPKF